MQKPQKTKLCWNCEGNVSRTLENCPYCGVYLSPEAADIQEEKANSAPKTPYKPPKSQEIPKAPYAPQESVSQINEPAIPAKSSLLQSLFLPLILLSSGTLALFFGFILLLFASNGTLTLQWNGEDWYFYAIAAIPLLALGWFTLDRYTEE